MDVSLNQSLINTATAQSQGSVAQAASILVMKKASQSQESAALALLQALPPVTALATSGNLGTQVNTYA